jgi:gluconokinase
MENKYYVLGIDLGTSSCKTVVMSPSYKILGAGSSGYFSPNIHSQWQEQDPDIFLRATIQAVRNSIKSAKLSVRDCIGISVGGALHSLLALDKNEIPLTGIMTWADNRAKDQVTKLEKTKDMHHHYLLSGCPNHPMYPLSKIIWLRNEQSNLFKQIRWFISAKEYLLLKLTGEHLVDFSVASGTSLMNIKKFSWEGTALELAGIRPRQLSDICLPETILKLKDSDFTSELGLPTNTPVIVGSSDAANSNLGVGAVYDDQLTCMVGSSGAIRKITRVPILDSKERTWCYLLKPDYWLVGGAINNGGIAIQWLQNALKQNVGKNTNFLSLSVQDLLCMAESAEPGSKGVICLPFFTSERSPNWNPNAKAVFFGLTIQHDLKQIVRAIFEGIGYRLLSVMVALDEISGKTIEIRASGGYTQSPFWLQLTADILNKELIVTEHEESSAVGAAFWALIGLDLLNDYTSIADTIKIQKIYKPDSKNQAIYSSTYNTYQNIYNQFKDIFDETSSDYFK